MHEIAVVGLGPGAPELLTIEARAALTSGAPTFWRTRRHRVVDQLDPTASRPSFDNLDASPDGSTTVDTAIVDRLLREAIGGPVVYAVPGHPRVGHPSVRLLLERAREDGIPVRIVPGVSLLDAVANALEIDPVTANFQIVDAHALAEASDRDPFAGGTLPISPLRPAVIVGFADPPLAAGAKSVLRRLYPPDTLVTVVDADGDGAHSTAPVALAELDPTGVPRASMLYMPAIDPLTSRRTAEAVQRIVSRLRAPGGCPWDREQTHQSLTRYMVEEAFEAVDALERGDPADMAEELGDVLLQVYLNAQIAEEAGAFVLEDVFDALASKLVRRHPHIFGTVAAETASEVAVNWARIKAAERRSAGAQADQAGEQRVPVGLPALARAQALLHRQHRDVGTLSQPGTPISEGELAAALAALVARAEDAGIDAEEALRRWTRRFEETARGTAGA